MTATRIPPFFDENTLLGRPLQAYPLSATQKYNPLISALIYWVLAFGFFFIGRPLLLRGAGPFPAFDDPQLAPFGTIFTLALPGLFALLAVVELTRAALNWRKVTVVYEKGLAFYDWRGWREWRWEEIEAIRLKDIITFVDVIHITNMPTALRARFVPGKAIILAKVWAHCGTEAIGRGACITQNTQVKDLPSG